MEWETACTNWVSVAQIGCLRRRRSPGPRAFALLVESAKSRIPVPYGDLGLHPCSVTRKESFCTREGNAFHEPVPRVPVERFGAAWRRRYRVSHGDLSTTTLTS